MSKAASTEALSLLHAAVAESLAADLADANSIEDPTLRAAVVEKARAQAITFLKNNNITAAAANDELNKLTEALKNRRRGPTPLTTAALDEAAELAGQRLQ